ncbi:MAG: tetratricopeptide repeat protein [Myxococcota bacterium]|nr:tetratricopeptide repeat protein [Myxococcota bacterium]
MIPTPVHASALTSYSVWLRALCGFIALVACGPSDSLESIRQMQQSGQVFETIAPLQQMIGRGEKDPEVFFLYGVALAQQREMTRASWPLRRAMESPEWYEPAATRLAELAIMTTDWDMATGLLDEMIERDPESARAHLLRAYARAQSRQDYEGTLEDVAAVLEKEPQNSDGLVLRGVALLGLGQIDEAGEAIEAVASHYEEVGLGLASSSRFCVVRATFAKEKGELDRTAEIFEECLELFPLDFVVVDEAVEFFDARGNTERSLEIVRGAFEGAPQSKSYRLSLAQRLLAAGEVDEAENLLLEAAQNPNPARAAEGYADLARFYFQRGEIEAATEAFEGALARLPDPGPEFMFTYADVLVAAGRYDEALVLAESMTIDAHRFLIRGRVALEQGDPETALAELSAGHLLWAHNAVSRYFAALAAERLGDFDRAIEEYRYAVRVDAGATDARMALARLYLAEGQEEEALQVIRHEAEAMPSSDPLADALFELDVLGRLNRIDKLPDRLRKIVGPPNVWPSSVAAMANGLREGQGPEAAIEFVNRADRLKLEDPANFVVLQSVMQAWNEAGRGEAALDRMAEILGRSPEQAHFQVLYAELLGEVGRKPAETLAAWRRAVELDPELPAARRGLGQALMGAGQVQDARIQLEKAKALDDSETANWLALAELELQLGQQADAKASLRRAIELDPYDGELGARLAAVMVRQGLTSGAPELEIELRRGERFGAAEQVAALRSQLAESAEATVPMGSPAGS